MSTKTELQEKDFKNRDRVIVTVGEDGAFKRGARGVVIGHPKASDDGVRVVLDGFSHPINFLPRYLLIVPPLKKGVKVFTKENLILLFHNHDESCFEQCTSCPKEKEGVVEEDPDQYGLVKVSFDLVPGGHMKLKIHVRYLEVVVPL